MSHTTRDHFKVVGAGMLRSMAYLKEIVLRVVLQKERSWTRISQTLILCYAVFRIGIECLNAVTIVLECILSMVVGCAVFCVMFDIVLKLLEREGVV